MAQSKQMLGHEADSAVCDPHPHTSANRILFLVCLSKHSLLKCQYVTHGLSGAYCDANCIPGLQAAQKRARRVFEAAVAAHGDEDWQLWVLYVAHVRAAGGAVGDVAWRAAKALRDPEPFREAMQRTEGR